MPFDRLNFGKVWTNEKDFPTYETSETQVREDMQYHPDAVKRYINEVLLPALEGPGAAGLIGDAQQGDLAATLADFVEHFESNDQAIRDLAAGEAPEAVRSAVVEFSAEGWAERADAEVFELRLSEEQHKRLNSAFGYNLQSLVDGAYRANTWEVKCTDVGYDTETGDIVLTAENAYSGAIVFFGV